MKKHKLKLNRDLDKPVEFFTFNLGKDKNKKIILPEEEITPWEALNEEIIWDPGLSD